MIFLLALALASHANEAVDAAVRANSRVQMRCDCQTPSLDTSDANLCSVIRELGRNGDPSKFDVRNPYGLCSPTWKSTTPEWAKPENEHQVQTYGTDDVEVPTRNAFVASGKALLSNDERRALVRTAEDLRAQVARDCCGTDLQCAGLLKSLKVSVCTSDADQDPSKPDPCAKVAGAYHYDSTKQSQIILNSYKTTFSPYTDLIRKEAAANVSTFLQPVVTGEIVFSPYKNVDGDDDEKMTQGTIRHEFGHACSDVRRQIAAKSLFVLHAKPPVFGATCALDELNQSEYRNVTEGFHAPEAVNSCLYDLAQKSSDPTSSAFIEDSCARNKYEEGMAEAFALYTIRPFTEAFPARACGRWPSKFHPASVDVFSCIIKGDPAKRSELQHNYRCQP